LEEERMKLYTVGVDEPFGGEFTEYMFPVELTAARLVQLDFGQVSVKESDVGDLFIWCVRHIIGENPPRVRQAVEDRQFDWLSRKGVEGPWEWLAANQLFVGLPTSCREAIVRIYNLCNACALPITSLKFKCEVPSDAFDSAAEQEGTLRPIESIATPQEDGRTAAEVLAEKTRQKVVELGRTMLDVYAFFVLSAFEKRLAPLLDQRLRPGYTRSAIEIILSAGIDGLVFSGEGEQRTVRFGDRPRTFGEGLLANRFRDHLSKAKGWVPLSELIVGIDEVTEEWVVPFIEDVMPDAIPSIEDGVYCYKLMEHFRFPRGFESFIRQCDFTSWAATERAFSEYYGENFLEDYHFTPVILKEVLGYYSQLCGICVPPEWHNRVCPGDVSHARTTTVRTVRKRVAVPIDINVVPLAADLDQEVPAGHRRESYTWNPNDSQVSFIDSTDNFIRLLAPAGSGKTTTMLFKCKRLLEANPNGRILLLTFTRIAAEELRQRMRRYSDFLPLCGRVDVTTLNAYGYRIVRNTFPDARLEESSSSWKVFALGNYLTEVLSESGTFGRYADDSKWMREHSPSLMDFFDTLKTLAVDHEEAQDEVSLRCRLVMLSKAGRGPSKLFEDSVTELKEAGWLTSPVYSRQLNDVAEKIMPLYVQSTKVLKDSGALTFEDQKYWAWKILKRPGMKMEGTGYAHIMVDEFQDVNPIDLELVKTLRELNNASLTIVGDDDQTIFEWRGATPQYIVSPRKFFFPGDTETMFTSHQLSVNYRSPTNIVTHAQDLIRHNRTRVAKKTEAANCDLAEIEPLENEAYDAILRHILADVDNPAYKSVAVITRKRSHLIPYQILLASVNRKFFAAEDLNVLLSDAFKNVIKMLDIHRRRDFSVEYALEILNNVRTFRLSRQNVELVRDVFSEKGYRTFIDFATGLMVGDFEEIFDERGELYGRKIRDFFNTNMVSDTLKCLGDEFFGFKKVFVKARDDVFFTDPPFEELANFATSYYDNYGAFISDLKNAIKTLSDVVYGNANGARKTIQNGISTKLHLMTGLRTKGKEYDVVYILHADDDVWPNPQAFAAGFDEGERRLFYVAMTRARKKLCFAYSHPTEYLREAGILQ